MSAIQSRARGLCIAVLTTVAIADAGCSSASRTTPGPSPNATAGRGAEAVPYGEADDAADDDGATPAGDPSPPPPPPGATGNLRFRRFDDAKKELVKIYGDASRRVDLYCGCAFLPEPGRGLRVDLASCGYVPARDRTRAERIEWEHAVPAAAFGRTFPEWREGSPRCVARDGRRYRGRKCARIASPEFARIEADLHNLFPVVGEVNGLRGDLPMGLLDREGVHAASAHTTFRFGACSSAIDHGVFLPRREVRGDLARAYKYMDRAYPERHLVDDVHRPLFDEWDRSDPPDSWERERNRLIAARQGNTNELIGD